MEVDTTVPGNLVCNWMPRLVVSVWISHIAGYCEWALLQLRLKNGNEGGAQKQQLHPHTSLLTLHDLTTRLSVNMLLLLWEVSGREKSCNDFLKDTKII